MEYASGGLLFQHIQEKGPFTSEMIKFYAAELIVGFENFYKHFNSNCYGIDSNSILLDEYGHILLKSLWLLYDENCD